MDLYFAIIIYNKECNESITIKKLMQEKRKNIIVIDNSTIKNENESYCNTNNITYIHMNGNQGVSKAYNTVLDYLNNKKGYIMWLDDDTYITHEYINQVEHMMNYYDIIIPIIRCRNKIVSPLKKVAIKYIGIDDINYNNFKNIYAINSCLTVNMNLYKNIRYNENLFLDNVDLEFFRRILKEYNLKIKILDSSIQQSLFLIENEDINKFKKRYLIYIKDNYVFCENKIERLILFCKVIYWSFKYSIKYKKMYLIKYIIGNYIKVILNKENK